MYDGAIGLWVEYPSEVHVDQQVGTLGTVVDLYGRMGKGCTLLFWRSLGCANLVHLYEGIILVGTTSPEHAVRRK